MALVLKDRVRETSTTTGTGSFTLGGTSTGFQSFSVIGDGNTTYYGIVNSVAGEWEVGIGTYTASGTVLSRDTILESSNGGSAVNFSAGTKDVFVTYPAEKSASTDTFASPPAIGSTTPAAATFTTLTATGQTSLGGVTDVESLRVSATGGTAGSNNYLWAVGGSTSASLYTWGTASNIPMLFRTRGSGQYDFATGSSSSNIQSRISHTASAVNYVQVTGAATGSWPTISSQGSDASISIALQSKGTSPLLFQNGSAQRQFRIDGTGAGTNYFGLTSSATAFAPVFGIATQSADTNVSAVFQSKGTGAIDLAAGSRGVNISNGGTVTAITLTNNGSGSGGYTGFPTITISPPTTAGGVQATATVLVMQPITASVQSGGTGYTLNDVVSLVGGTQQTVAATFRVTGVSGGVVTAVTAVNYAPYLVLPTAPVSTTGGTGTGLTLTSLFYAAGGTFTITNAGSGYVEQPTVSFSGGGGSGAAAYATVGSNTSVTGLGSNINFYTAGGYQQFQISNNAGATTGYFSVNGASQSGQLFSVGTGNAVIGTSSTGALRFTTSYTLEQLRVAHTASAVNYVQVTGSATGSGTGPSFSAAGSDAAIPLTFTTKSTGAHRFVTGAGLAVTFVDSGGTTANFLQIQGRQAGNGPIISTQGSDTNIDLSLTTKGTGAVKVNTGTGEMVRIADSSGTGFVQLGGGTNPYIVSQGSTNAALSLGSNGTGTVWLRTNGGGTTQAAVAHTASAVNYVQVTGAATGGNVTISTQGSDASVFGTLLAKGSGGWDIIGNGVSTFRNSAGANQFRVTPTSSAVNLIQATGAVVGAAPSFSSIGSDTNIDLALTPKGTGAVIFNINTGTLTTSYDPSGNQTSVLGTGNMNWSGSAGGAQRFFTRGLAAQQFQISDTASAVNYVQVTGAATGSFAAISAQGSDAVTGLNISSKGAARINFFNNNGTNRQVSIGGLGTAAVNYIGLDGSIAGAAPVVSVSGTDTNIDLTLTAKGTGSVNLNTGNGVGFKVIDAGLGSAIPLTAKAGPTTSALFPASGNTEIAISSSGTAAVRFLTNTLAQQQFQVTHTASAVNYVQVTGAATASRPTISSQGSDSSIGLNVQWKGTGNMFFQSGAGAYTQLRIWGTNNAVNNLAVTGTAAGSAPILSAEGSDTNIDLTLTPKGTGNVVIGSAGLLVGTTTTSLVTGISAAKLSISGSGDGLTVLSGSGNDTINVAKSGTPSGTWVGFFAANGTGYGNITVNGTGTAYNTTSDYRLKNIDGPLVGSKDFIMALKPKQGTWKADGSKFVGFVADEFQQVSPTSVTGEKDAVDAEGKPIYQTMQASSSEVMANLIALVQEQQAVIEQLKADVAKLKAV